MLSMCGDLISDRNSPPIFLNMLIYRNCSPDGLVALLC